MNINARELKLALEETQFCEICGSDDLEKLKISDREGVGVGYVRCNICTLVFANYYMTKDSLNEVYSKHYAKLYPSHNLSKAIRKKLVSMLRRLSSIFSNDKAILDYGCGDGRVLDELSAEYSIRYGLDYIDSSITTEMGSKIFSHMDMVNIPNDFDVILISQVVEHMENPLETVKDICAKLKIGGLLVVEVPGLYSFPSLKSEDDFFNQFKLCHKTFFTAETLSFMLQMAGLKVLYSDNSTRAIAIKLNQDSAVKSINFLNKNAFNFFSNSSGYSAAFHKIYFKVFLIIKALWFKFLFTLLPKRFLRKVLLWR